MVGVDLVVLVAAGVRQVPAEVEIGAAVARRRVVVAPFSMEATAPCLGRREDVVRGSSHIEPAPSAGEESWAEALHRLAS